MASFFLYLKNLSFKIINFLIGQTPLFILAFGWFLIITGLLFLVQPEKARKKILRQGFGVVIGFFRFLAVYLALVLLGLGGKFGGILPKILVLLGITLIIWAFLAFKKKTFKTFEAKFALIPVGALKVYAWVQVVVGALMIMWQKRIW